MTNPTVSVSVITYQHAPYIRQALDSVLMQQVDFQIEICLGEDGSSDGTREICQEYGARHPETIRLFLRDRSDPGRQQFRAPFMRNFVETLKACRGKYIALLDGDDYWTDPLKLQRQVDFLEAHREYSLCFSNGLLVYEPRRGASQLLHYDSSSIPAIRNSDCRPAPSETTTIEDLARTNYIHTASVVFRNWIASDGVPRWISHMPVGDWPLLLCCASRGSIRYMPDAFIAHRVHSGGAWSSISMLENNAGIMRVYPSLLESGILPAVVMNELTQRLPRRLFELRRCCNEASRMDLYRETVMEFLCHAPGVSYEYTELIRAVASKRLLGGSLRLALSWMKRTFFVVGRASKKPCRSVSP